MIAANEKNQKPAHLRRSPRVAARFLPPAARDPRRSRSTPQAARGSLDRHREFQTTRVCSCGPARAAFSSACSVPPTTSRASVPPTLIWQNSTGRQWRGRRDDPSAIASPSVSRAEARPRSLSACVADTRTHYAPAYFEGSLTVKILRPFFRRLLKIARPHFVAIRVRNPCLRMRRLFLGRYVGFPMISPNDNPAANRKTKRGQRLRQENHSAGFSVV